MLPVFRVGNETKLQLSFFDKTLCTGDHSTKLIDLDGFTPQVTSELFLVGT